MFPVGGDIPLPLPPQRTRTTLMSASCPLLGTEIFPLLLCAGCQPDRSQLPAAQSKNDWMCTDMSPYILLARHLIKV